MSLTPSNPPIGPSNNPNPLSISKTNQVPPQTPPLTDEQREVLAKKLEIVGQNIQLVAAAFAPFFPGMSSVASKLFEQKYASTRVSGANLLANNDDETSPRGIGTG